jgi:hypothetical protein
MRIDQSRQQRTPLEVDDLRGASRKRRDLFRCADGEDLAAADRERLRTPCALIGMTVPFRKITSAPAEALATSLASKAATAAPSEAA